MRGSISIALVVAVAACGSKAKPRPAVPTTTAVGAQPKSTATAAVKPTPASPSLTVSDELARQCKLHLSNAQQAPKFGYDEAELLPADRDVLQQLAQCLLTGPLKDKRVQLVGRADPRGTDEYNLGLGSRRAETVRTYLQRLGVPGDRLAPTTRGELDASGNDEASWQRDRRVDLELAN
ncbi:MAG TPA: OmpA family protein [Kofleriaceae bacterium]|nr:OmpA family protein [Kofleriaceae bacterium]